MAVTIRTRRAESPSTVVTSEPVAFIEDEGAGIVASSSYVILGTIADLSATALVESVRLDWTAAANATSQQPQYSSDGETWTNFGSALSGGATQVTVTGLTADVEYSFRVIASDGTSTTTSNVDAATPVAAASGVIFEDDFSTDKSASYFESDGFVRTAEAGPDGGHAMVAAVTQSQQDGGSLKLAFGRTPDAYIAPVDAGVQDYREIYYSFDFRASSGFQSVDGMKVSRATAFAQANWAQAMIAHVWTGNGGDETELLVGSGVSCVFDVTEVGKSDRFDHTPTALHAMRCGLDADDRRGALTDECDRTQAGAASEVEHCLAGEHMTPRPEHVPQSLKPLLLYCVVAECVDKAVGRGHCDAPGRR